MAAGRSAVRMSEQEVADFLASQRKVQVATIDPDGAPHLTTLFHVLDEQGRIGFWTYARSQKVVNLRRDERVTCLVEDGEAYEDLRGVSITGRALLLEQYDTVRALGARVLHRMTDGADLGELGEQTLDHQARKRVGVLVEPQRVRSWDHRKMTAPPGLG